MSRKKWLQFFTTFFLGLVALAWLRVDGSEPTPTGSSSYRDEVAATSTNALVLRAIDGDTLEASVDGMRDPVKVRLLGVDTPESVDPRRPVECFGKEASKFTASLTQGRRVRLMGDPKADEVDKYGRLLRNVILADGTDLNAELVRSGYAHAYLSYPLDPLRKAELSRLQTEAEASKRGLWDPDACR